VPNVTPFEIESIKPSEDTAPRSELSGRMIKVDTKKRILDLVDGGKIIASFPITPGSTQLPAPVGIWKIIKISLFPCRDHRPYRQPWVYPVGELG
jgi:hypothetical protein